MLIMTVCERRMDNGYTTKARCSVFSKMEAMINKMEKSERENGISMRPKRSFIGTQQKSFHGYDMVEWFKKHYGIYDAKEATYLASLLCQYGYIYPLDLKSYIVKEDRSAEYKFQTPYYWPYKIEGTADSIKYAIYLQKRSIRNKQKHGLELYEQEAFEKLLRVFSDKEEFIQKQAKAQVDDAKKKDRQVKFEQDLQERAHWRIHRPPPGTIRTLEEGPKRYFQPSQMADRKKKNKDFRRNEVKYLKKALEKPRMKFSKVFNCYCVWNEQYRDYDPFLEASASLPSNPWISEDTTFWEINDPMKFQIPTELTVKKWSISFHDLMSDETGIIEFEGFLKKEYSRENIRFWQDVEQLKTGPRSHIQRDVDYIFKSYLTKGSAREINIDSKTLETVKKNLAQHRGKLDVLRYVFDPAQEHIYLLMKKDSYPRFLRSEQYINLRDMAHNQPLKKRFFSFGSGKVSRKQTPSPKLSRRSNSGDRDGGSDISLESPVHTPQHSFSTGNLKELDIKKSPPSSSGHSPGLVRRRSDDPNRLNAITGNNPRRKSNLEVPRVHSIPAAEKRKSEIPSLNKSVTKSNSIAPLNGSQ